MPGLQAASAVNRFGLGGRPGEIALAGGDPRGWLEGQLEGPVPSLAGTWPDSLTVLREEASERDMRRLKRTLGGETDPAFTALQRDRRHRERRELTARQQLAVGTLRPFLERLVRFWSNHFAISTEKRVAGIFSGAMEREAIRPRLLGRFEDLLLAVEMHPGMLRYLDNANSTGQKSRALRRTPEESMGNAQAPRRGLNENLAREILELHTLGVNGGYTQGDVTELARAITGWSLVRANEDSAASAFKFRPGTHEPGPRTLLGRRYAEGGVEQGQAMLRTLAVHPATARHLATKLARHCVADVPSPRLIDAMADAYLRSGGELMALYRALLRDDESWTPHARKFRTPADLLIAAQRLLQLDALPASAQAIDLQARMGHPAFQPRSPAGFADGAADWIGPDALSKRVQAAQLLAELAPTIETDPVALGDQALGARLDAETRAALARAESPRQGIALLLASPAFQWRS